MKFHREINSNQLIKLIKSSKVSLAGNIHLKIYGTLTCSSGKRMKKINRVFFKDENEAIGLGYRPCGHCLSKNYQQWKIETRKIQVEKATNSAHL